jgi:glucosylceramidase
VHFSLRRYGLTIKQSKLSVVLSSFILLGICSSTASGQQVKVYVSSLAGDRVTPKPVLQFVPQPEGDDAAFRINDTVAYQKIVGFGASFLEAGMICLNSLEPSEQETVLSALFDPDRGAGFSAMKTVIGATDFMSAGPFYSYDDVPGDVEMKHFSVGRDLGSNGLITYIKRARRYGKFVLEAPMDYPPDWMLFNVNSNQDVDPRHFNALARYYSRYLREYETNDVFIDYLSLFNEPGNYTKIPYSKIGELTKNYVGPLLEKEGLKTKIMLSEGWSRGNAYENYPTVLDDPVARKYIAAMPYHGYDFTDFAKIVALHQRYPDLPLWMTEICHYKDGDPTVQLPRYDFEDGDFWGNQIISDLEAGASAWIYWNMILDEKGGPWLVSEVHHDGPNNVQHPVVIIDRTTKAVTYTGLYYYLKHFSKFVRPGAVRVETLGSLPDVRCVAFKTPEGGLIAECINSRRQDVEMRLAWQSKSLHLRLPALSITTCLWGSQETKS